MKSLNNASLWIVMVYGRSVVMICARGLISLELKIYFVFIPFPLADSYCLRYFIRETTVGGLNKKLSCKK